MHMWVEGILSKLSEHFLDILLSCQHEQQLQLRNLDINWIIILAKEHSNVIAQNLRPSLQYQQRIS